MSKYKIKVVKQIYLDGKLYSKPEKAARMYTAMQCHNWWQAYLVAHMAVTLRPFQRIGAATVHIDIALLHERQVRMYRRVLPIFKQLLQKE